MSEHEIALNAEGDLAGADFRLGERTGTWSARRHSGRWGCGLTLLIAAITVCWIPFLPFSGLGRVTAGAIIAGVAVLAIRLMSDPQAHWWDRLYLYSGGIAQFAERQTEPAVLRWADLEAISVDVVTGYEGDALTQCELRDGAGTTMTVSANRYGDACEKVIDVAGRLLAGRLAGALTARFDAGEMLIFGDLSIDLVGIRARRGEKGKALWFSWRDMATIDMTFYAHRLTITPRKGMSQNLKLDGDPNDILAWYVITHAAARAGVTVTGDPPEPVTRPQPPGALA